MMSEKPRPGDMYLVTEVIDDRITKMMLICSEPPMELVRIENEHGQVNYLSREEYEGRKNGTWPIYE